MANIGNMWQTLKNKILTEYSKDAGKMIVHAGALSWFLSSLAQVSVIVFNDKIPPEQKKFLIPQEIADAAVNVASFYLVTKAFKDIGQKLVSTGKWSNKAIKNFVQGKNIKLGDYSINLEETFKKSEDFHKIYQPFKNGVAMITTTIGSIISSNIITPIARNKFGANRQKAYLADEKDKRDTMIPAPIVLPAQNRLGMDDYKKQVNLNAPQVNTNGVMKI